MGAGAPKGNKNAVGHGRPPMHTDELKFNKLIEQYFEYIQGEEGIRTKEFINPEGEKDTITENYWIRRPEPPTVTGLTLWLGFADKKSLYDYKERDCFVHSIKKAVTRIEKHHEEKIAWGDKCTGNIFALKNFGWKDKIEQSITTDQTITWNEEKTYEAND